MKNSSIIYGMSFEKLKTPGSTEKDKGLIVASFALGLGIMKRMKEINSLVINPQGPTKKK